MTPDPSDLVAMILPPHEGFGPGRAGAVGTIVHNLARTVGFRSLVFGGPQSTTFSDVVFRPVRPAVWCPGNVNLRYGAALLWPLSRLRPALIEVHNRPELALFLARCLPRIPVMLFLHNDPQSMRRARRATDRAALLRRLTRVVTVSDYLRGRLLDGVDPPQRAPATLPNCIDLAALPPPQPRDRLILYVGRIVADKGPDAFVAACASVLPRLIGWRAEMLGADRFRVDSPETEFVRLTRIAADAAGVRLIGYRDHAAVLDAMAHAAIVVVPSRWEEPFGLVALEAMASGAALVCSPRGGLPEVAGDAAVYADPDQPGAVKEAILSLAANPTRRAALAKAGLARARDYDLPVITAQLAALRLDALRQAAVTASANR